MVRPRKQAGAWGGTSGSGNRGSPHSSGPRAWCRVEGAVTGFQERPWDPGAQSESAARPHPAQLAAASPIRELAIHSV